jgi:hypothetical protein
MLLTKKISLSNKYLPFLLILFGLSFNKVSAQVSEPRVKEVDSTIVFFDLASDSAFFHVDEKLVFKVYDGDSLKLSSWYHYIELSLPFLPPKKQRLDLRNSDFVTIEYEYLNPAFQPSTISDNASVAYLTNKNFLFSTDNETKIFLQDSLVGIGHTALSLNAEKVRFRLELQGKSRYRTFSNQTGTFTYRNFYLKPTREKAITYSFVPGLAQFYKRHQVKGILFASTFGLISALTVKEQIQFSHSKNEYEDIRAAYSEERNQSEALRLGNEMHDQKAIVDKEFKERNYALGGTLLLYGLNVIDGLFSKPKLGYRKERTLEMDFIKVEEFNLLRLRYNL